MSVCRPKEATFSARPSLRCRISLLGAVLTVSIFGVSSASATPLATPLEKAADAVGPVLSPVTGTSPTAPPQPPGSTPPRAPVAVPAVPVPPVKTPTTTTPNSSHPVPAPSSDSAQASSPGVDLPPLSEVTGGTKGAAGISAEGAHQAVPSALGDDRGSGSRGARQSGIRADSVEPAKAAPLRLLRAYIWPAIALGQVGELLEALQARWEVAPAVSDVSRLLSGLAGVTGADLAAGPSESTVSNPPPKDSRGISVPSGSQVSLFVLIISCAALMAWLVFTLRREFRSMHWPL